MRGFTIECDTEDGSRLESDVMLDKSGRGVLCISMIEGTGVEVHDPQQVRDLARTLEDMADIMENNTPGGVIHYRPILPEGIG